MDSLRTSHDSQSVTNYSEAMLYSSLDTRDQPIPLLYIYQLSVIQFTFCQSCVCLLLSFDWTPHDSVMKLLLTMMLILKAHQHTYLPSPIQLGQLQSASFFLLNQKEYTNKLKEHFLSTSMFMFPISTKIKCFQTCKQYTDWSILVLFQSALG